MSRMSELAQTLDILTDCGEALIRTANALREMFSGAPETPAVIKERPELAHEPVGNAPDTTEQAAVTIEEAPAATPKAEPKKLTFVDVRKAFSAKSHAGYTEQVRALIAKYGADRLSAVKEEDYAALMADLEAIT